MQDRRELEQDLKRLRGEEKLWQKVSDLTRRDQEWSIFNFSLSKRDDIKFRINNVEEALKQLPR